MIIMFLINSLRHELELKIKLLQTPNALGFNDNINNEGNYYQSSMWFVSISDIGKHKKINVCVK